MIKSISEAKLYQKDVLLRVDFNVPFEKGTVSDDSRILAVLPTIRLILKKGGRPIILSHFGRPTKPHDKAYSLKKLLPILTTLFQKNIFFCESTNIDRIKSFLSEIRRDAIILLENTRFFDGEDTNSKTLSTIFSQFGDLFCNDAFSASHRSHASTVGIAERLPSYSGLHLQKELSALNQALLNPKKPLTAIIGGSKVSTKITLLKNLIKKVDHLIIGGGMANTFLYAQKREIGQSLCEKNLTQLSQDIITTANEFNCEIHLPLDAVCARKLREGEEVSINDINSCPPDRMILDSGPKTIAHINNILKSTNTLIWNGPLGAFETPPFDTATKKIAKIVAKMTRTGQLVSVAGGGDTVAALNNSNITRELSYVSNAGGAFLEWMEGKDLPGLLALHRAIT